MDKLFNMTSTLHSHVSVSTNLNKEIILIYFSQY